MNITHIVENLNRGGLERVVLDLVKLQQQQGHHCQVICLFERGTLAHVDGRKLDAIRTPDGHLLPGEFFPHMLKDVPGLRRFQLVQRRLDRLELALVCDERFDDASMAYIRRELAKVVGDSVALECRIVDELPLTPSGKLRVTVSALPPSSS